MEVVTNEELYYVDIYLHRISHHSQKIGGIIREKIISNKELLSKAKDIADRLCNQKNVEETEITSLLIDLRELQSWLLNNKIPDNQYQQIIMESIDSTLRLLSKSYSN